jgi:hypothetical protein
MWDKGNFVNLEIYTINIRTTIMTLENMWNKHRKTLMISEIYKMNLKKTVLL